MQLLPRRSIQPLFGASDHPSLTRTSELTGGLTTPPFHLHRLWSFALRPRPSLTGTEPSRSSWSTLPTSSTSGPNTPSSPGGGPSADEFPFTGCPTTSRSSRLLSPSLCPLSSRPLDGRSALSPDRPSLSSEQAPSACSRAQWQRRSERLASSPSTLTRASSTSQRPRGGRTRSSFFPGDRGSAERRVSRRPRRRCHSLRNTSERRVLTVSLSAPVLRCVFRQSLCFPLGAHD